MYEKITIKCSEIDLPVDISTPEFPTYTSPLANNENQYSRATRPENVGEMKKVMP